MDHLIYIDIRIESLKIITRKDLHLNHATFQKVSQIRNVHKHNQDWRHGIQEDPNYSLIKDQESKCHEGWSDHKLHWATLVENSAEASSIINRVGFIRRFNTINDMSFL